MSDTIRQRTIQFIEEALSWLRSAIRSEQHRWKNFEIHRMPNGGFQFAYSTRPDFRAFLTSNRQACARFDNFNAFLQSNDDFCDFQVLAQQNNYMNPFLHAESLSHWLIGSYLSVVSSLHPEPAKVDELATNFERCINTKTTRLRLSALLDGFECNLDKIECGLGYHIRRISIEEYAAHLDRHPVSNDNHHFRIREFLIERIVDIDFTKKQETAWSIPDPTIDHILTTLRILGRGKVSVPQNDFDAPALGELVTLSGSGWSVFSRNVLMNETYSFEPGNIGDLKTIFHYLTNSTAPTQIRIAVHRLNSAIIRLQVEDSLIDHMVALEAIFGDNSDQLPGTLTYKLAMRAAAFLATDLVGRRAVVKTIREAQSLRSKVVHGAARLTSADNESISRFGDLARKAVRRAIVDHYAKGEKLAAAYFDNLLLA